MRMASGLAVIPAFDEAERIAQVLQAVTQHAPEFDVLVVDDASRDATAEIARTNGAAVVAMKRSSRPLPRRSCRL
jgi:glycosyltransferase involved in cell wall biosynthesis